MIYHCSCLLILGDETLRETVREYFKKAPDEHLARNLIGSGDFETLDWMISNHPSMAIGPTEFIDGLPQDQNVDAWWPAKNRTWPSIPPGASSSRAEVDRVRALSVAMRRGACERGTPRGRDRARGPRGSSLDFRDEVRESAEAQRPVPPEEDLEELSLHG